MDSEIKMKQVEAVFCKVIDSSIDSIGGQEIDKYFNEIKNEFNGNLENSLRNCLNHSRTNLQVNYFDLFHSFFDCLLFFLNFIFIE